MGRAADVQIYSDATFTPPKFNMSPLKNGGWKTILSYWVSVTFQGRTVQLREGKVSPMVNVRDEPLAIFYQGIISHFHELSPGHPVIFSNNDEWVFHCHSQFR